MFTIEKFSENAKEETSTEREDDDTNDVFVDVNEDFLYTE